MVSQFISSHKVNLLGDINFDFPEGIHAIGRLDNHSEGLLILTTNKKLTRLLFQSKIPHKRTYLVKVKKPVSEESLQRLRTGVKFKVKDGEQYMTPSCEADLIHEPENLFVSSHPLPDYPPYTWLRITLMEGKFRQVRKMVAAIHHRCLRLIRVSIEDLHLGMLQPGEVKEIEEKELFQQLRITDR